MIGEMKPYEEYKDSGVAWLGEVPTHWQVSRIKRVALLNPSKSESQSSISSETPVTFLPMRKVSVNGKVDIREVVQASQVWTGFTYFRRSDVLLAKITPCFENGKGAYLGRLPTEIGFGSTEFHVLRARSSILPEFLYLCTKLPAFRQLGTDAMTGAAGQQRVPTSFVGSSPIPLPSIEEQSRIAHFLDYADRRIRRYVRTKRKLIELLEEQKQVAINEAVTRGLDPEVSLVPSGVAWLGDIPKHWRAFPLRRATLSRCDGPFGSGLTSNHYTDQGIRVIRLQNIGHATFKNSNAAYISAQHYSSLGDHTVVPGDLLIAGLGDSAHPAGRACVAPSDIEPAMVKADCFRFRIDQSILLPEFAAYHLTATSRTASAILSTGATRQRINLQSTGSRTIAVPPIQEQKSIVSYLSKRLDSIDCAMSQIRKEIVFLREFRTRLIADVVTGKLDVREAAAKLPTETEDSDLEELIEEDTELESDLDSDDSLENEAA